MVSLVTTNSELCISPEGGPNVITTNPTISIFGKEIGTPKMC